MKSYLMNLVVAVLVTSLFSTSVHAQTDSIYAEVNGDSVTIWHKQTFRNCASRFLINYELNDFFVEVMEIDTVGPIANCLCYYDLSLSLANLPSGEYTVDIFGTDIMVGDTLYLGSTSFEIAGGSLGPTFMVKLNQSQSDCYYTLTEISQKEEILPKDFELLPVYPNPFNPKTNINFSIPSSGHVTISIYDNTGQDVTSLINTYLEKGSHRLLWNAINYSSGIYFIAVKYDNIIKVQKLVLLK